MNYIERADGLGSASRALVLTDDGELRNQLSSALVENGIEVLGPAGTEEALRTACEEPPPITFLDLDMTSLEPEPLIDGLESVRGRTLVVLTSEQSIPRLRAAVESGAGVYLKKPVVRGEVRIALAQLRRLRRDSVLPESGMCGASPEVQAVRKLVIQAAQADAHVTVCGEPGVGKRVVGRMIHDHSARRGESFLQLSCAGFKEEVLADLLFGKSEASPPSSGHLAQSARGTLLIDDIDLLHDGIQSRLFDYLVAESGAGAGAGDCPRIVAVSSRSLSDSVSRGEFHSGLCDILDRVRIEVPPLREHKSDIPLLADHFARSFAHMSNKLTRGIEPAALGELMRYDWPGNVRELEDILEHAVRSSSSVVLSSGDLPVLPESPDSMSPGPRIPGSTIHDIEKDAILRTLEATGGSTSKAARILEMSVRKIQYKLKEYRIEASSIAAVESMPAVARTRTTSRKNALVARGRRH